jgi:hypothetical protein
MFNSILLQKFSLQKDIVALPKHQFYPVVLTRALF